MLGLPAKENRLHFFPFCTKHKKKLNLLTSSSWMAERNHKKTLNDEKWYPLTALNYLDSQAVNQVITSTKIYHIVTFRVFSKVVL